MTNSVKGIQLNRNDIRIPSTRYYINLRTSLLFTYSIFGIPFRWNFKMLTYEILYRQMKIYKILSLNVYDSSVVFIIMQFINSLRMYPFQTKEFRTDREYSFIKLNLYFPYLVIIKLSHLDFQYNLNTHTFFLYTHT